MGDARWVGILFFLLGLPKGLRKKGRLLPFVTYLRSSMKLLMLYVFVRVIWKHTALEM